MAEYKELKTSWRQRLGIIIVAVVLLGSTVAIYMGIVLGSDGSSSADTSSEDAMAALEEEYNNVYAELNTLASPLSDTYFEEFSSYRSRITAYNAAAVTELKYTDLKVGDGEELAEGATNYLAYYIGWCADEEIFDSSLDSTTSPTALSAPLPGGEMIEGWNEGIVGMKIGGVREITIPGDKAYGESQEICGGTNSPLKFVVMAIEPSSEITEVWDKLNEISNELMMYYYGYM